MELRGQLSGVSSLLPLGSETELCLAGSLPAEPSHQPESTFFYHPQVVFQIFRLSFCCSSLSVTVIKYSDQMNGLF